MNTIARHLIAEYYRCDLEIIDDLDAIRRHMLAATAVIGATVVGEAFHKFDPQGVSGTVVIAESHLSIHTWPESGYVAVDIFTCGGLDPRPGFLHLKEALGAGDARLQEIVRGLPDDLEARDRTLLPDDVQIITEVGQLV